MSSENQPRYVEDFIGFHPSFLRRVLHMLGKVFKRRKQMDARTPRWDFSVENPDEHIAIPFCRRPGKEP